jgi:hypothetical protein
MPAIASDPNVASGNGRPADDAAVSPDMLNETVNWGQLTEQPFYC